MRHQSQLIITLAGNLFLISNTFLCLSHLCAYRLYEIGSWQINIRHANLRLHEINFRQQTQEIVSPKKPVDNILFVLNNKTINLKPSTGTNWGESQHSDGEKKMCGSKMKYLPKSNRTRTV